jgi:hypothetical protein
MLDWLLSIFSAIISFIMGLFGCGTECSESGEKKTVRFEDEEKKPAEQTEAPPAEQPVVAA